MDERSFLKPLALLLAVVLQVNIVAQEPGWADPETVSISPERLEILTRTFRDYTESGHLPGAVVLLARGGHVAYLEAFGEMDRENNVPMQENTIFRIASQSKAIISVGIMSSRRRASC